MTDNLGPVLTALSDTGWMVADPAQDVRDRIVVDHEGNELGKVDELFVDTDHRVRMLRVVHGGILGIGAAVQFLPVQVVRRVEEQRVMVDQRETAVADGPLYEPAIVAPKVHYAKVYERAGYPPAKSTLRDPS